MTPLTDRHMACEDAVRAIWDYLDGEITSAHARCIRQHLEICVECRDLFTFEGAFLRAVARVIDDDARQFANLRARVVEALMHEGYSDVTSR